MPDIQQFGNVDTNQLTAEGAQEIIDKHLDGGGEQSDKMVY